MTAVNLLENNSSRISDVMFYLVNKMLPSMQIEFDVSQQSLHSLRVVHSFILFLSLSISDEKHL